MKSLGEEIPGYKLREIIKEVDTDRNGTIEFNEFVNVSKTVFSFTYHNLQKQHKLNMA